MFEIKSLLNFLTLFSNIINVFTKFSRVEIGVLITSENPTEVCQTFLFTEELHDSDITVFDSNYPTDLLPPVVLVKWQTLTPRHGEFLLNLTSEVSLDHILKESVLGTFKLVRNCVSIFLLDSARAKSEVDILISHRFVRQHKDYFFFVAQDGGSGEAGHIKSLNVRYKQLVTFDTNYSVTTFCGDRYTLFSHVCPILIQNRHFRLVSSDIPNLVRPETNFSPAEGALHMAMIEMGRQYNYTSTIRLSTHNGATGIKIGGIWKGNVGDVFARRADFSIGNGITSERHRLVDFGVTQLWFRRVFFIRTPNVKSSWWTIFRPLTPSLWIATSVALFCVVVPMLYIMTLFQDGWQTKPKLKLFRLDVISGVLDTLGRICLEQNFLQIWRGVRVRVVIVLWSCVWLVVVTGYKSKLTNFLTFFDREDIPPTHLALSLSDYQLFFRDYKGISMLETNRSTNPIHKRFMSRAVFLQDSFECFRLALTTEKSACMDYITSGEYITGINMSLETRGKHDVFVRSKDIDIKWGTMWTFPKGSPLTASFDRVKGQALAGDLFGKWMSDDWTKKKREGVQWLKSQTHSEVKQTIERFLSELEMTGPNALGLRNLFSIFILLAIGLALALLVWFVENLQQRKRSNCFNHCSIHVNVSLQRKKKCFVEPAKVRKFRTSI